MNHETEASRQALNLLKTARGHVEAIIGMINDDRYCIDVSRQITAVQGVLKKANLTILRQHMDTCVKDAIDRHDADDKLKEIMTVMESVLE